jgi:hypothetical protein
MVAPLGAPTPHVFEGQGTTRDYGVPGAAKNTGDDAWLVAWLFDWLFEK